MIITIDGPVATGKSSVAKMLAKAIGFIYFDTGAMFRAVTYGLLKETISFQDEQAIDEYLKRFQFEIKIKRGVRHYFVDGEEVTDSLRLPEVTHSVSVVATHAGVRQKLLQLQREMAQGVNAVFEGRDMGTTVFPDADFKIYLTGRLEVRAKRRFDELKEKYPEHFKELTLAQCMKEIEERDKMDRTRELSPLREPEGAVKVDTSDLSLEEVVDAIRDLYSNKKINRTIG